MNDLEKQLKKAKKWIKKLEKRLQIDYYYVGMEMKKTKIPQEEKESFPDKIICLELEIILQQEYIETLKKELNGESNNDSL